MSQERTGDWARLDELSSEVRRTNSEELAARLVDLRHRLGVQMLESGRAAAREEPPVEDLFAGTNGVPEIHADQLSGAAIAAGVRHHGALLVRSLYSGGQLERLRARTGVEHRPAELPLGCAPAVLQELLQVYAESGLLPAIREYLDGEPLMFGERAKLRHHTASRNWNAVITWHQDVAFFGRGCSGVNCWAAVSPCGADNPGLALVPRRFDSLVGWDSQELAPLDYGKRFRDGLVDELARDHPVQTPVLEPGDALLFDQLTLHSTSVRPWTGPDQIVTISWFFKASAFPSWGTPLAV